MRKLLDQIPDDPPLGRGTQDNTSVGFMQMEGTSTNKQIISLIHHVELNKAGWRDRGVQQLITAILWLMGRSLSQEELLTELRQNFAMDLDLAMLKSQIDALRLGGTLMKLPDEKYKLSEQANAQLGNACAEAEQIERDAKSSFLEGIKKQCPPLYHEVTWKQFNDSFLLPLIMDMGARTYELISGTVVSDRAASIRSFLENFPEEARPSLRDAIIAFIDPNNSVARSYILRYMNSFLFVEASNLSEETIKALSSETSMAPEFSMLVDTNFLFSLLGLHENPSNDAAVSLQALIHQLKDKLKVRLFVSPETVDETRRAIEFSKETVSHLRLTPIYCRSGASNKKA